MSKNNFALSINPFNGETIRRYSYHSRQEIERKIEGAQQAFESWRHVQINHRCQLLLGVADILDQYKHQYARVITMEMGKPIIQSEAEIEKCAWVCRYYVENAEIMLQPENIKTDASESYIRYDPLGVILAVMPWNYPFWQVFRFAAPNLLAGNTALLKHASNVSGCALELENIFLKAGFPEGVFQSMIARSSEISTVIEHPSIKATTLTGSMPAGQAVASQCGKNIKKSVLELGGSNACVIFEDVDLDNCMETLVQARFQNTGQSCIAGKRFIVLPGIYEAFITRFREAVASLKTGDPLDRDTEIGPMASKDLANDLQDQLDRSVALGAKIILGGSHKNAFFTPTIVNEVEPGMPVFDEETFGPVAAVIRARNREHAIELVNQSNFGLGVSFFTADIDSVIQYIPLVDDGAVFINDFVKSDPRLPFGGTKISGYGRELSLVGIREFTNIKTVYIK